MEEGKEEGRDRRIGGEERESKRKGEGGSDGGEQRERNSSNRKKEVSRAD